MTFRNALDKCPKWIQRLFINNVIRRRVPRSWNDITLEQFIQLNDLPKTSNAVTDLINRLSVLTLFSEDEIRKMTNAELSEINRKLKFIERLPDEKQIKSFMFNGSKWMCDKIEFSTVGQITDILQMNADENNVGAKILNAMSVIYYKQGQGQYDAERFQQNRDELLTVPFPVALNSTVFFSRGLTKYLPNVLRESLNRMTVTQTEQLTRVIGNELDLNAFANYFNGMTLRSDSRGEM